MKYGEIRDLIFKIESINDENSFQYIVENDFLDIKDKRSIKILHETDISTVNTVYEFHWRCTFSILIERESGRLADVAEAEPTR